MKDRAAAAAVAEEKKRNNVEDYFNIGGKVCSLWIEHVSWA